MFVRNRCLMLVLVVLATVSAAHGSLATAAPAALGDTWGLPPTYIYIRAFNDSRNLLRLLKPWRKLRVQRTIQWRRGLNGWGEAALDPTGRWIVNSSWQDSIVRKHDVIDGSYVDHNVHLRVDRSIGCDSVYFYAHVDRYIYRFRLSDLSFVDSTRIDQTSGVAMFGVTNDSIWVGDTTYLGYHVYPASGMGRDSAHYVRYQYVGECASRWTNPAWDGRHYYVGSISWDMNPLRRFPHDWSSHEDTILSLGMLSVMAVPLSPFYARDVSVSEVQRPTEMVLKGQPMTVRALIANYGNANQEAFDVILDIGNHRLTKTVPLLNAGDTLEIAFDPYTPDTGGFFALRCFTALAGDQDTTNDFDTSSIVVADYIETFDSSSGNFTADPPDKWARGMPREPRPLPHSGNYVWGDQLEGYYWNDEDSRLITPQYTALMDTPVAVFSQWYQTEPERDGGNLAYTTDNGANWAVLEPWTTPPYPSLVAGLQEMGYSGSLTDWQQAKFRIPVLQGGPFNLRWRFGSDSVMVLPGWIIDDVVGVGFEPTPVGLAEKSLARRAAPGVEPTVIRGVLRIADGTQHTAYRAELMDVSGRKVMSLVPGPNDASRLAPGVYFVRFKLKQHTQVVRKVIVE